MPHHKSAVKRLKTNEKSRLRNRVIKGRCRTAEKKFRANMAALAPEERVAAMKELQKLLDQAASHGVIKTETASRKVSRLRKAANQVQA